MRWVSTPLVHGGVQRSSRSVRSHRSCALFFWIIRSGRRFFLSIGCSSLCLGSGGCVFRTLARLVPSASTKHAEVVGEWARSSEVSLPSFPSLLERSGFLFCLEEPDESLLGLLLDEEADLLSEDWFLDEDDEELAGLFDFCSPDFLSDFLDSREISDWRSQ